LITVIHTLYEYAKKSCSRNRAAGGFVAPVAGKAIERWLGKKTCKRRHAMESSQQHSNLTKVLGVGLPGPLVMVLAVASHFGYGGFWGAVLATLTRPATIWKGLGLGVFLPCRRSIVDW
jgi:hypothetical protein